MVEFMLESPGTTAPIPIGHIMPQNGISPAHGSRPVWASMVKEGPIVTYPRFSVDIRWDKQKRLVKCPTCRATA